MAEKTPVELALNSISWQLKRIADSLEELEDILNPAPKPNKSIDVDDWLRQGKSSDANRPKETLAEIQARLRTVKPRLTAAKLFGK
jgi:uncharacterized alpha-E superfamily protein